MNCRRCGASLDRPGDYCLRCSTANCDVVVVEFGGDRATLTMLDTRAEDGPGERPSNASPDGDEGEVLGRTAVTTVPDDGERTARTQLRNYAGRVADEIRRKRPETVYAAGERDPLRETRAQLRHEFYRVPDDDPVEAVLARHGDPSLDVVDAAPAEKLGGAHSTLIGGRKGWRAIRSVAEHPHVKKIIPGPIDAGGSGSRTGVRAKVTRADEHGNVRLLLRNGSSVQENRVVTTAGEREVGELVREDLNDALADEEFA
ncbi:DUF2103 domain-containing protein [Halorarum salinum]|uniref:DUF2103 domain-containing protein n=1 Tax=Halorarum salinum TaxID=2743089 RepID=A0A7D5L817_9EURY|nr:DUF2103 domain-containing protein [Halobaculum salinum]QLG60446.1 DUF2103 domain-containing protein [Halobaculum salinum]